MEALRAFGDDRLADARDAHLSLWRLTKHPDDAYNVGSLSYLMHDWVMAAEYFTLWLTLVEPPGAAAPQPTRDRYDYARLNLQRAREHVEALEIHVSEPGAEVLVDGRRAGVAPLGRPVFVKPGEHRIVARRDHAQVTQTIQAEAGEARTVRLVFASPSRPSVERAPQRDTATTLRWVGASLATGGVALGAGLLGASAIAADSASVLRDEIRAQGRSTGACANEHDEALCRELSDTVSTRYALINAGVGSFIAGGAIGAVTLSSLWWAPGPESHVRIRATAGRTTGMTIQMGW